MPPVPSTPHLRIILGLGTFGPPGNPSARVTSLDDFNKILSYFQSSGYNEVDTARHYVQGQQEAFTAKAKWKERGLKIATKVYPTRGGEHKPENLRRMFQESLDALETDCVDIFYLHAADRTVPFQETLAEVDKLHKEGKFVKLGLSNFAAFEVAEVVMHCKANGWVRPTVFQAMYNVISTSSPSLRHVWYIG